MEGGCIEMGDGGGRAAGLTLWGIRGLRGGISLGYRRCCYRGEHRVNGWWGRMAYKRAGFAGGGIVSSCQSGLMQNSTHGISEVVPF